MPYDPAHHRRRSIRLREFDYRTPGCYAVTICTNNRVHRFGKILGDEMVLSPAGQMILQTWSEIPTVYPDVEIDAFVVMPNHIHGIIVLPSLESDLYPDATPVGAPPRGCASRPNTPVGAPPRGCPSGPETESSPQTDCNDDASCGNSPPSQHPPYQQWHPQGGAPTDGGDSETGEEERLSLPNVMERFKSLTTYRYGLGVRNEGWPRYRGRFWQRNYYERVVRDDQELTRFRRYIEVNPARWFEDPYRD